MFAKQLELGKLPEWSSEYIDYMRLKEVIRKCHEKKPRPKDLILTAEVVSCKGNNHSIKATVEGSGDLTKEVEFFAILDANLAKVEIFYAARLTDFTATLEQITQQSSFLISEVAAHDAEVAEAHRIANDTTGSKKSSSGMHITHSFHSLAKFSVRGVKVAKAKQQLKHGLAELERGLGMLRSFGVLNNTGFVSILEKHDKLLGQSTQASYVQAMSTISFHQYEHLDDMRNTVKDIYAELFTAGDKDQALTYLKRTDGAHMEQEHMVSALQV
jgi:SPX domain protein involved in polyphosphate accumulation